MDAHQNAVLEERARIAAAIAVIKEHLPADKQGQNPQADVGLILGSGLGKVTEHIQDRITIPYENLPGFTPSLVDGHASQLCVGRWGDQHPVSVVCMQGRTHCYEGSGYADFRVPLRVLKQMGCHTVFITNAAGSLCPEVLPGQLMLIKDHINFQCHNPLVGPNDDTIGPRFVAMEDAYDAALRVMLLRAAQGLSIPLTEGVYVGTLGPSFETPAEIRAFRTLGADAVGMSTVPEVIVARHCGLRVALISVITNLAAGLNTEALDHAVGLGYASQAVDALTRLLQVGITL